MLEPSSALYRLLATKPAAPGAIKTRKTLVSASRFVLHGLDAAQLPLVVIPLAPGEQEVSDSSSRGVDLQTFPYVLDNDSDATVPCAFFRCLDRALAAQFAYMVDDLMATMARESGEEVGRICIEVLDKWRDLLGNRPTGLLSVESQVGLIGELHVLERLLGQDPSLAMDAWAGPSKARHDFRGASASVEVKATTSRESFNFTVHGWYQLEQPPVGPLFLYIERLERVGEDQGESLPQLVSRLLSSTDKRADLLGRLKEAGYDHREALAYDAFRYSVLARRCYEVGDDFPRLTREMLVDPDKADAIRTLRYVVEPVGHSPATSDDDALDFVVQKLGK